MTPCGVCGAALETRGDIERNPDKPRCPNCLRPELPLAGLVRERIQDDRDEDERDARRTRLADLYCKMAGNIAELGRRCTENMEAREALMDEFDRQREDRIAELERRKDELLAERRRLWKAREPQRMTPEELERLVRLDYRRSELLAAREKRRAAREHQMRWLAYGWNEPLGGNGIVRWQMSPAQVFRPLALWVWEPSEWGVLVSVTVNGAERLKQGLPLRSFISPVRLSAYWDEIREGQDVPPLTSHRELGRSVRAVLETRETPHRLDCPTLGLGQTLELGFRGTVRALSLLGRGYAELSDAPTVR